MKPVERSIHKEETRRLRFLLCDTAGVTRQRRACDEAWVFSPVQCLAKAMEVNPEIIVIHFGDGPIRGREALVELIHVLKRNRHTRNHPVLALLRSKHRKFLEDLNRAGVDFVDYIGESTLDSPQIRNIIDGLKRDNQVERLLASLCPFLSYRRVDSDHEMVMCGACLSRVILGGHRLRKTCQTAGHLHCEFYKRPRRKS